VAGAAVGDAALEADAAAVGDAAGAGVAVGAAVEAAAAGVAPAGGAPAAGVLALFVAQAVPTITSAAPAMATRSPAARGRCVSGRICMLWLPPGKRLGAAEPG
jgi:hypothetical protein